MSELKEFTYEEVKGHESKNDLYMVIHDKVYSCGSFVDEHPGGEEVLMDVAGQDATDSFEDVGHSDEAREILQGLLVGALKRGANDPKPKTAAPAAGAAAALGDQTDTGVKMYVFAVVVAAAAFGAYKFLA